MPAAPAEALVLWPFFVYGAAVLLVIVGMLGTSFILGERHTYRNAGIPYESGIDSTGSARIRFTSDFFLIGVFFVVFDLESVFIYSWATAVRELGWPGYGQVCVFIAVLVAALAYLWRDRALDL